MLKPRRPEARLLGSFVPKLTGKVFEKYGFSAVALITEWATIAGQDLAACSVPERLNWPRNVHAYTETPADRRGRPGATLVLRVDGAHALDVQYRTSEIIDRINAYFGYCAVSEIRIKQAPVDPPAHVATHAARSSSRPHGANASGPAASATPKVDTASSPLDAALARLEQSVRMNAAGATTKPETPAGTA
jgi:hypothetical protein